MKKNYNFMETRVKYLSNFLKKDEAVISLVFVVILAIASIAIPQFRTSYNLLVVIRQFSLITIVAFGQGLVLITGGFDLSVGYIVALSNMAVAYLLVYMNWPIILCIVGGILIGTACGFFNGILVTRLRINPLIATLGSGWIFNGLILVSSKGWPITGLTDFKSFAYLGQGYFLKIPMPIWIMLIIGILLTFFLRKTILGRYLYAIGGNDKAGWLAGLNVPNIRMFSFIMSGVLSGLAGVLLSARLGTAQANAGVNWTLPTVAAAVLGGVALSGGKGEMYGVFIGAALLGVIDNILVLMKISSYWQGLVTGFVLLFAVSFDVLRRKTRII
jgi:ribose transport system permease protein